MGSHPVRFRSRFWPRYRIDWAVFVITLILMPTIYLHEMFVVYPSVWHFSPTFHTFVPFGGVFIFMNIVSNFVGLVSVCSQVPQEVMSTRRPSPEWEYCEKCVSYVPSRSWHCNTCRVCILKRDHHCLFGGCCVGQFNCRYFIMYLVYVFIGTLYCVISDTMFVWSKVDFTTPSVLIKIGFPAFAYLSGLETLANECCILLCIINLAAFIFVSFMLRFHICINLNGQVTHDVAIGNLDYDLGKAQNVREVLGNRWYIAWIFPLIPSPLPRSGLDWEMVKHWKIQCIKSAQKTR